MIGYMNLQAPFLFPIKFLSLTRVTTLSVVFSWVLGVWLFSVIDNTLVLFIFVWGGFFAPFFFAVWPPL